MKQNTEQLKKDLIDKTLLQLQSWVGGIGIDAYGLALAIFRLYDPHLISSDEIKREVLEKFAKWYDEEYFECRYAGSVVDEYLTQSKEGGE